ncbi:MAG: DUF1553 domain-containing protein [Planctomycetota bacterium]|nr:MAG: DUF1553 domain-containing protein [Planctomycetota bacterium]
MLSPAPQSCLPTRATHVRSSMVRAIGLLLLVLLSVLPWRSAVGDERVEFFERNVRPQLLANCTHCHGAEQQESGLRLDSREAMLAGGDRGPAIVPGDPEASLLLRVVRHAEEDLEMPPEEEPLAAEAIAQLAKWIAEGAIWPEHEATIGADTPVDRLEELRDSHWAFQPVGSPIPPEVGALVADRGDEGYEDDIDNDIDRFVVARLAAAGLKPGRRASRRTLVRRVYFDLLGLPPTPEEIDAFLADESDDAYPRLIDRLLARPEYGERWGRHWLDVVRYADTAGDASDYPVPEAYKYRNYVIDAFNADLPYDEFIRQQLAGDLLPAENDDERWNQVIATGYIAISRRIGVDPVGLRHVTIESTLDNLGKTFLGLTLGCARCHNHKFDPVSTADYYALYGIFDSSVYPHAGSEHAPYRRDFVYRVGKQQADEILRPYRERLAPWDKKERAKFNEYQALQGMKTDPKRKRSDVWAELEEIREQRRPYAEAFPDLEIAYAIAEGRPHDVHVQKAGEPKKQGELVRRGFLTVLGGASLPEGHQGSGRLELANWIADPENPLTVRVMANRVWHYHFGRGLVKSTSDFGMRGTPPTHPELLDYLSRYFIDNDWSVKALHRLIMNSRTYQLDSRDVAANSAVDPNNDLIWRANRQRLSAEQLRDSLLMFGDELDRTPGGRHPFPHRLTYFYRQHEPFVGNFPTRRRSVYLMQQRIQKNVFLDLFDGPDGNVEFAERKASTTTLQALFFMNSPFIHERARVIARRALDQADGTSARVRWAYETVFNRPPDDAEVARAEEFLASVAGQLDDSDKGRRESEMWAAYVRGMISSNEFLFID